VKDRGTNRLSFPSFGLAQKKQKPKDNPNGSARLSASAALSVARWVLLFDGSAFRMA